MPVLSRDHQPATTAQEIFQEARERLRIAQEAEGANRQKAVLDLEFEDGQQWPDDMYNQRRLSGRPALTINHTRTFVRRVVNNMRQQRPRIKVHPVGEGADIDLARKIGGLIRHIEQRKDGAAAYDIGGESAVKIGWGYWRILSEYIDEKSFDQELYLGAIHNSFTVYFDPSARQPAGEDAEWVIITELMKRSEFERKYPKEDQKNWAEGAQGDQNLADWETEETIRLAEYFRIVHRKDTLYRLSNGQDMYASEYRSRKLEEQGITIAVNALGDKIQRPTSRRQIEWHRINGSKVVESVELPGHWIPVIRCEGNTLDLNGRISRKGMIRDMMDTARMYNYWRTKETEVIALTSLSPWIGQPEHFDGHPEWNDANQKAYSKLTYSAAYIEQPDGSKTPLPPPTRVEPPQIPAAFVGAAESAMKDLMALAGMPHEPGQDKAGEVISGVALRQRQALSDIGHFQYYDNQTRSIAHTGRVLLDLIPHYYSEQRMQRIIGEDGVPTMIELNQPVPNPDPAVKEIKNNLSVGRYDVVMDTGPGYESKRLEQAEMTIDMLKVPPLAEVATKNGADLIFRYFDMDEMADRLVSSNPEGLKKVMQDLPKQAQDIISSMQNQMQALQKELQGLQLDHKYKATIAELQEKAETQRHALTEQTKRQDIQVESQTKLHDTLIRAASAEKVAEINQAGGLLKSHVDARYDAVARKDELAAAQKAEKSE